MLHQARERTGRFQRRLAEAGIDVAILTDEASIRPGVTAESELGGRIGDSIVVTESGCDYLTDYPREILMAGG